MRKKVVGLVILMMILFAHSVMAITNPNGTSGTCAWELNNSGDLVIRPTSGEEGTLASWWHAPWQDNCDQIKTVRFEGTVKAQTCVNMFNNCSNLTSIDLDRKSVV